MKWRKRIFGPVPSKIIFSVRSWFALFAVLLFVFWPASTVLADIEPTNNNIPGEPIPSSPFNGSIALTEADDVYRVYLSAGQQITASITGDAGTEFSLVLFGPGSTDVWADTPVDEAIWSAYPNTLTYDVPSSGDYYLDVFIGTGAIGNYTVTYTISGATSYTYYFPWYDCECMDTWILVGNPSETTPVAVDIYLAGDWMESQLIPAGQSYYAYYEGEMDGPVEVESDAPIFTTQRSLFDDSFCEIAGFSDTGLSTEYYFPWYDCLYMKTWILVGNPSETTPAAINIYLGGSWMESRTIPAGESYYAYYSGTMGGPVEVTSNIPVFATQRSLYGPPEWMEIGPDYATSFCEIAGFSGTGLSTEYYFPWYDCLYMKTWILVGNPQDSTVSFSIFLGGNYKESRALGPGQSYYAFYDGQMGGPVKIVSTQLVFATQRSIFPYYFPASFWEICGIKIP
jgi:hypothetical protein